ncbi:hypothetical protein LCGC14_2067920 [marine sediment metagenome]|uniref:Uncharacterized protein n=1 Tax=marine sediment metagenome TaxID=412755 RepID=A0A0F9F6L5_9ZZZZ
MVEALVRRTRGRVTIYISEDVAAWHDDELYNVVRELDELIVSMETGKSIQTYPLVIRS